MHLLVPDLSSGVGQPPDQVGEVGPHLHQWHGRPVAPANPSGSSSGEHCCKPGSGGPIPRLARRPRLRVTPVPGAHASTVNSSIEARVRAAAGSWGGATVGPTIADATADVVADGARLMCSCTRRPCSARHIPVVRPMTPAPTTTTSYGASASSAVTAADPGRSACPGHLVVDAVASSLQQFRGRRSRGRGSTCPVPARAHAWASHPRQPARGVTLLGEGPTQNRPEERARAFHVGHPQRRVRDVTLVRSPAPNGVRNGGASAERIQR